MILHGPEEQLLRRFYELRLKLWDAQGDVHPYRGRELRGLLSAAGFEQVDAFITSFSYGTAERVRMFGLGRAADCRDEWYVNGLTDQGFADQAEIDSLERAWTPWAESPIRSPPSRGVERPHGNRGTDIRSSHGSTIGSTTKRLPGTERAASPASSSIASRAKRSATDRDSGASSG